MKEKRFKTLEALFQGIKRTKVKHKHPTPKAYPWEYLRLHGRPKKLAKWGFKMENDQPGKVVKVQ